MRRYKHNFWQARLATNPRVSSLRFICIHISFLRLVLWDSVRCTAISVRSTICIFPHYGFNFKCIKKQGSFLCSQIHTKYLYQNIHHATTFCYVSMHLYFKKCRHGFLTRVLNIIFIVIDINIWIFHTRLFVLYFLVNSNHSR